MAGEHILKLLIEENGRIAMGHRWLLCDCLVLDAKTKENYYTVYERKLYKKNTKIITVTTNEEDACRVLKGE